MFTRNSKSSLITHPLIQYALTRALAATLLVATLSWHPDQCIDYQRLIAPIVIVRGK